MDVGARVKARRAGWVWWLAVDPPEHPTNDQLAEAAGLRALGDGWFVVDRQEAGSHLTDLLHRDMAYAGELMPMADAAALAGEILELVDGDGVHHWTNRVGLGGRGTSWNPATEHTFDAGVAMTGASASLIVWFADED